MSFWCQRLLRQVAGQGDAWVKHNLRHHEDDEGDIGDDHDDDGMHPKFHTPFIQCMEFWAYMYME